MSSSRYTVGLGEGTGISSRVLKPPGGGSSDIFGTNSTDSESNTPRRVKNYLASSILSPDSEVNTTPGSSGGNKKIGTGSSQDRLFGTCEDKEKRKPMKNIKTSIFSFDDENTPQNVTVVSRSANPVTGEGYEDKTEPVQTRRNPPGGVSSKLW